MIMEEWPHDETREVDHVIGAFFLVRRSLFESLGGFDERFFVYLEDVDFSVRAGRAGWRSVYLTEARAYHKGGGTSEQVKARRLFYSLRSRMQYAHKHFPVRGAIVVGAGTLLVEPLVRLGWAVLQRSGSTFVETIQGYAMLWNGALRSGLYRSDPGAREDDRRVPPREVGGSIGAGGAPLDA